MSKNNRVPRIADADFSSKVVLIVESNPFECKLLLGVLSAFEFAKVNAVSTAEDALKMMRRFPIDCIVTEALLDEMSGVDLIKVIRQSPASVAADMPILLCTGSIEIDRIVQARDAGVDEILAKPYSAALLYQRVHATIFRRRPFLTLPSYVGPDRRRGQREFDGEDRRGRTALSQDQIDGVLTS